MTPFEQARENILRLAEGLTLMELIQTTIKETKNMSEEESDMIWIAIFSMLEATDKLGDAN